jgi:hypothetical protein
MVKEGCFFLFYFFFWALGGCYCVGFFNRGGFTLFFLHFAELRARDIISVLFFLFFVSSAWFIIA